jgi:hypothetical protein
MKHYYGHEEQFSSVYEWILNGLQESVPRSCSSKSRGGGVDVNKQIADKRDAAETMQRVEISFEIQMARIKPSKDPFAISSKF